MASLHLPLKPQVVSNCGLVHSSAELGKMIAQARNTGLGHMGREFQDLGYESYRRKA